MELFLVGGIVRDQLMGLHPKDHDFAVVLPANRPNPFAFMRHTLEARGVEVFVETPEFLTIRGRFARDDTQYPGVAADFVLARKDSAGSDGRRPDFVTPGTLLDDLARRDFTVNAMALDADGRLIDPHNGRADLDARVLRFVGDPMTRIREDALRVMRAIRFHVTKGLLFAPETAEAVRNVNVPRLLARVSEERRAEELSRMFRFDTEAGLTALAVLPTELRAAIFAGRVRLDSTLRRS